MFRNLYKGINVIVISFLVISTVSAQDAREPKITIEESPDKFTIILESDDVTRKITTDSREDFISKYPHLYRKFRNQIDGKSPATHLSEKNELLRVEAPVIERLLRHPDIESRLKVYKTLTDKGQCINELIMPLIDQAASAYDKIIIEHTPDKFSITITKGNVTRRYEERNKESFINKFPDVYKKYENTIENKPNVYTPARTTALRQPHGAFLGIFAGDLTDSDIAAVKDNGYEGGVKIDKIIPDSAAERHGLKNGDIIVAVENERTENMEALLDAIMSREPGQTVGIMLVRDGKLEDVEVRLGQKYGEMEGTEIESWHRFKKEKHEGFRNIIENLKKQLEALKREIEWLKEHKEKPETNSVTD